MYIEYFDAIEQIISNEVQEINKVDWYNDQYERYEDLKAVKLPAAYIEFDNPFPWTTNGNGLQTASAAFSLHIVDFDVKDKPNDTFLLAKKINKALHGKALWNGQKQLATKMVRIQSSLLTNYDQMKVIILRFDTTFYDDSTIPETIPANTDFTINQ